jgi:hypothetical protein
MFYFFYLKALRFPFFNGLVESNVNQVVNNPVNNTNTVPATISTDLDDINDIIKASELAISNTNSNNVNSNSSYQQQSLIENNNNNKKKPTFKDSIEDIDDMLMDIEKKYTGQKPTQAQSKMIKPPLAHNQGGILAKNIVNSGNNGNQQNNTGSLHSILKTPQKTGPNSNTNTNANIRNSILTQFKEDPIFADLLNTTSNANTSNNKNTVANTPSRQSLANNSTMNMRRGSIHENKVDTLNQKKKFDDLFNNILDTNNTNGNNNASNNKSLSTRTLSNNNNSISNSNNNNNNLNRNNPISKNLFDDLFPDDDFTKPTNKANIYSNANTNNKKLNIPTMGATNQNKTNMNIYNTKNSNNNSNTKTGRDEILEEIFGNDLFGMNRSHTPAASKTNPLQSKKNLTHKDDDIFLANNNNNNNNLNSNKEKDPFFTGLEYELSFLKDDQTKAENQFNTRRSRFLPSGKRENLFNPNSANKNSAKAWNQPGIKIDSSGVNTGKQSGYVPSFMGSGKGEKSLFETHFIFTEI